MNSDLPERRGDGVRKVVNYLHRNAVRISSGRIGGQLAGMPTLSLTTIGRKSGLPRTVMLTVPIMEKDYMVIVASRGGGEIHPSWYHNLRDNPDVEVSLQGGNARPMHARVATHAERDRLWPRVTASYGGYANYQEKADRIIPLVILTAADGSSI